MPDFTSFSVSVSGFLTGTGAKTTPTPISDPGGPPKPHFHPRISLIHGWPKSHPSLDLGFFSRESAPWCKPSPSGVPLVPPLGSGSTVTPHKGPHGWGWVPVLKIEITVTKWHLATLRFRFRFTVAFVKTETETGKIIKIPKPVSCHCSGRRTRNRNRE